MNYLKTLDNITKLSKENSPALFIFAGLAGMGVTMFMVNKVSPKAHTILESKKDDSKIEKVKSVAPLYLPAALTFAASTACIMYSYKINMDRLAKYTTAYALTERKLAEYQKKVIDTIGEDKEEEIQKEIVRDHIRDNEEYIQEGDTPDSMGPMLDGKQWFWDDFSKRFFRASLKEVFQAKEDINVRLQLYPVKLNEFYCELGLEEVESLDIYEWAEGDSLEISFEPYTCRDGVTIITALHYDVPVSRDYSYRY